MRWFGLSILCFFCRSSVGGLLLGLFLYKERRDKIIVRFEPVAEESASPRKKRQTVQRLFCFPQSWKDLLSGGCSQLKHIMLKTQPTSRLGSTKTSCLQPTQKDQVNCSYTSKIQSKHQDQSLLGYYHSRGRFVPPATILRIISCLNSCIRKWTCARIMPMIGLLKHSPSKVVTPASTKR